MGKNTSLLLSAFLLLTACGDEKGEQFEINGQIASADGQTLYFEAATLNGIQILDSARLDAEGDFQFCGPRPFNPEFYRLRIQGQIVNLSVDSTETIRVEATWPDMATDYRVEGSPQCEVIRELSLKQMQLQQTLINLFDNRQLTIGEQQRITNEQVARYKDEVKQNYILKDPAAAYAYFALFQAVGGRLIFDPVSNPDDVKYAAAVATAWDARYPGTTRTENLRNIALQGLQNTKRRTPIAWNEIDTARITVSGLIDISLPDINGRQRNLSDMQGKVVLLDFTAYSMSQSQERIMQLRQLYNKYAASGFDIYQVSIDPNEHYWKTACEHLPWVCVYEARGEASDYLSSYVVSRIPTYFLIDRNGDLVARDEQIPDVDKAVKELCSQ